MSSRLTLYRLLLGGLALLRCQARVVALRDSLLRVFRQLLRLGQQVERFLHLRIAFGVDPHAFLLAEFVYEQLGLDIGTDPIAVLSQVGFSEGNFLLVEELAELLDHGIVNFKLFAHLVIDDVVLGEVEEGVFLQQRVLKLVGLDRGDSYVRSDAAAAVHGSPAVGHLDFVIDGRSVGVLAVVVVVVVQRDIAVIALNQTAAGGVVLGRGQRQSGVLRQRIHGLHQALAEGGLAGDQAAIVVLNGAGNNLSRRSRAAVHQHHQRILLAAIAMSRLVNLLRRSASVVGNNDLSLLQELVGHADAFAQQSAGILPQVEDQAVEVTHLIKRLPQLVLGRLLEAGDVNVAYARPNHEMHIHAIAGNLVAYDAEVERLVGTFT